MGEYLNVPIRDEHVHQIADYFCSLIFREPPEEITEIKQRIPDLAKKFPLGLISDTGYITGNYIRRFLQQEDLLKYFTSFMFSDEQPYSKPHRSVFEKTAANLEVTLNRLIHIGDLERTDIAGARNCRCIAIKYTGGYYQADHNQSRAHFVINDFRDLPGILEKICNGDYEI